MENKIKIRKEIEFTIFNSDTESTPKVQISQTSK